ncbi:MAG: hypothetical protein L6R38_006696 [Xanthoria sp. 2 TBL-2021]|nr:MAG: hypothetical protein L6R38_006696 [Xanthoria sp. 2 TBL-2021]
MSSPYFTPTRVFSSATALRVVFLLYGLFQDAYSLFKYTDIDYMVFTDAARYVSQGLSPYERETYRYTPLLAWILIPTSWPGTFWFSFGKVLFAISDVVAGWFIFIILQAPEGGAMTTERALKYASIWLLNPMVATISTRGSSEGLLAVMVVALLWAVARRRLVLAGMLLGLSVHLKIYPFIYGASIVWSLESMPDSTPAHKRSPAPTESTKQLFSITTILKFFNRSRTILITSSLITFITLNLLMYAIYSTPFLQHTFLYHLTRIDHRHNFSPYNTLLHLSSAAPDRISSLKLESLAFIPQIAISAVLIPITLSKKNLAGTMLAQTFAFVAFNKVCTSQYFLWYLIFLPFYLPYSSFLSSPRLGILALTLWVGTQALWLHQAYQLEFLGLSTFVPGLFVSGLLFFAVNVWILGIIVEDIGKRDSPNRDSTESARKIH